MVFEGVTEKRSEGGLLQWYKIASLIVFTLGSTKSTNLRLMGYMYLQMCGRYDIENNFESYIAFKNPKYPHKNRDSRPFLINPRMCHDRSSLLNQPLMRFQRTLSSHPPSVYPVHHCPFSPCIAIHLAISFISITCLAGLNLCTLGRSPTGRKAGGMQSRKHMLLGACS